LVDSFKAASNLIKLISFLFPPLLLSSSLLFPEGIFSDLLPSLLLSLFPPPILMTASFK
jgi:hypothetical protein